MYRYYKSHIDGKYNVVLDNPLIGCVDIARYGNENDAIKRVETMNEIVKR